MVEEEIKTLTNDEKIKKVIREMYGASFKWRSEKQEEAVKAMMEGVNPLIVMLPTNAGKSLIFMLLITFDDTKMTIMIISMRALINNLLKRCRDAGIDAII